MKKFKLIIPVLVAMLAITTAWTNKPTTSDKVWFQVNPLTGQEVSSTNGIMSETPPLVCNGENTLCARSLSIAEGEVSLNTGSSTVYHINSGVDIRDDYNFEASKN